MRTPVIVEAVRTPFGKHNGKFRDTHSQDLAATPLIELQDRLGFDPEQIDDILYGCVTNVEEQGWDVGRTAALSAGWGEEVPGTQLNRQCGSSQEAVTMAAAKIRAGYQDIVIGGGIEHMTRVPMGSHEGNFSDTYYEEWGEYPSQGEAAERIADRWDITRREADELAADSQQRWGKACDQGRYNSQIAPVKTTLDGEPITVTEDGHPRPETTADTLADLPLSFREEGNGILHPGNSSGIVDGSSAVLVTSQKLAEERGWEPMARITHTEVVGVDPVSMLTGPIPATQNILEEADMTVDDIDIFECNEAFAPIVLAWLEETGAPWKRTNVNGGAIAHGHPLGATGAGLVTKLVHELDRRNANTGLVTMCIGLGQGIATIFERI